MCLCWHASPHTHNLSNTGHLMWFTLLSVVNHIQYREQSCRERLLKVLNEFVNLLNFFNHQKCASDNCDLCFFFKPPELKAKQVSQNNCPVLWDYLMGLCLVHFFIMCPFIISCWRKLSFVYQILIWCEDIDKSDYKR